MKIHEYLLTVTPDDTDALGHVNNVRYVQWVQDAAESHWNSLATPAMKDRYIWVVLRHQIDYKGQAFPGDVLRIKTYVTRSEGVTSTRVVEILSETSGKLLVKAETNWCLLDSGSKRPVRLDDDLKTLF